MCVSLACFYQYFQILRRQRKYRTIKRLRKDRRTRSVIRVMIIIQSTGIMKECKQLDHHCVCRGYLAQIQPILPDTRPMGNTMDTLPV